MRQKCISHTVSWENREFASKSVMGLRLGFFFEFAITVDGLFVFGSGLVLLFELRD